MYSYIHILSAPLQCKPKKKERPRQYCLWSWQNTPNSNQLDAQCPDQWSWWCSLVMGNECDSSSVRVAPPPSIFASYSWCKSSQYHDWLAAGQRQRPQCHMLPLLLPKDVGMLDADLGFVYRQSLPCTTCTIVSAMRMLADVRASRPLSWCKLVMLVSQLSIQPVTVTASKLIQPLIDLSHLLTTWQMLLVE